MSKPRTAREQANDLLASLSGRDDAVEVVEAFIKLTRADERERCCAVLCRWCGDPKYRLVWHHEEWRHYRNSDDHVEYCEAAAIRRDSTGEEGS